MFSVHCPTHGTEVLLPDTHILGLERVEGGHRLRWRCWCSTEGTTVIERVPPAMVGTHREAV